jgi:hypothetical protein
MLLDRRELVGLKTPYGAALLTLMDFIESKAIKGYYVSTFATVANMQAGWVGCTSVRLGAQYLARIVTSRSLYECLVRWLPF